MRPPSGKNAVLALIALGIVFGDIGTSPLYAFRECFSHKYGIAVVHENILGILSLIFWSLIVVISLKYTVYVMRADNDGEGGVLALLALLISRNGMVKKFSRVVFGIGIFGAALFYGDAMLTPAISVACMATRNSLCAVPICQGKSAGYTASTSARAVGNTHKTALPRRP